MLTHPSGLFRNTKFRPLGGAGPSNFFTHLTTLKMYFKSDVGRRAASCWALPNNSSLYLGHDLDLSRSRDVIGHMTNRSAICHLLLVSHCNQTSISNLFRDIRPQNPCARAHTDTRRK